MRQCPVCDKPVAKLVRHLMQLHKLDREVALATSAKNRKPYTLKNGMRSKDTRRVYKLRQCPVNGCKSIVRRLCEHLKYKHKGIRMHKFYSTKPEGSTIAAVTDNANEVESIYHDPVVERVSPTTEVTDIDVNIYGNWKKGNKTHNLTYNPHEAQQDTAHYKYKYTDIISNISLARNEICGKFEEFLTSSDYALESKIVSKQMKHSISNFMKTLCKNSFEPLFVFDNIRTLFDSKVNCNQWKAATAKTYKNALKAFYCFVGIRKVLFAPKNLIISLQASLDRLGSSYKKKIRKDKYQKMKATEKILLQPADMEQILASDVSKLALQKFHNADTSEILRQDYCLMRNYLLVRVFMKQGSRTGVLANLTLKDFLERKKDTTLDLVTFSVTQHKTATQYGDAVIVINNDVENLFVTYLKKVRPASEKTECPYFFRSWSGKKMESPDINAAVKAFFKSINNNTAFVTIMRKSVVTTVHEYGSQEDREILAVGMDHDLKTAEKYYAHRNKENLAKRAYLAVERASKKAMLETKSL